MPNLVHGQDPGGALRPIQVDDNGNLSVDLVSGVNVSTTTEIAAGTLIQTLQLSGSVDSVAVNSIAADQLIQVKQVSGSANSVVVNSFDSSLGVNQVSGAVFSTTVTNDAAALLVNQVSGSNFSSEVSGVARQTNPTAVADAAVVKASFDDLGRQVITPYQVRDLVSTAYSTITTGIETTLIAAAGAGVFLDCVEIVCANTSDAAVDIDFRSVTAGNVEFSITVPADSTAGKVPAVPWPQGNPNNNWTSDVAGSDVSGTTVNISALFIRNI
jgi:hypothetical protein